ncbi:hypothetical protein J6590_056048 [Homalodisca vitripennis]|nr:hypothetical protein J6590_056048 [Homalodisca vitripennis]
MYMCCFISSLKGHCVREERRERKVLEGYDDTLPNRQQTKDRLGFENDLGSCDAISVKIVVNDESKHSTFSRINIVICFIPCGGPTVICFIPCGSRAADPLDGHRNRAGRELVDPLSLSVSWSGHRWSTRSLLKRTLQTDVQSSLRKVVHSVAPVGIFQRAGRELVDPLSLSVSWSGHRWSTRSLLKRTLQTDIQSSPCKVVHSVAPVGIFQRAGRELVDPLSVSVSWSGHRWRTRSLLKRTLQTDVQSSPRKVVHSVAPVGIFQRAGRELVDPLSVSVSWSGHRWRTRSLLKRTLQTDVQSSPRKVVHSVAPVGIFQRAGRELVDPLSLSVSWSGHRWRTRSLLKRTLQPDVQSSPRKVVHSVAPF